MFRHISDYTAEAERLVHELLVDFKVKSRHTPFQGGAEVATYIVSVPFAVMRSGVLGRFGSIDGKPTRFGSQLREAVEVLPGVEVGLDNDLPHAVFVWVEDPALYCDHSSPGRHQHMGLPVAVKIGIQAAIMRHRTPGTRFTEYLRRFF